MLCNEDHQNSYTLQNILTVIKPGGGEMGRNVECNEWSSVLTEVKYKILNGRKILSIMFK
jgi:hypothetical protein